MAAGQSLRSIAVGLGRAASTVSREVAANGGPRRYRAAGAEQRAWARGTRPKRCKLAERLVLRDIVAEKLRQRWSPQQIAGWLKTTYPRRRGDAGVARDDLSHPVHPVPRRLTQGTDRSSADQAGHPTPSRHPAP